MHAVIPFPELVIAEGSVDHFQPQNRLAFAFRIGRKANQNRTACETLMSHFGQKFSSGYLLSATYGTWRLSLSKGYRGFESTPLRHTVWTAEKLRQIALRIARNRPIPRFAASNRTRESDRRNAVGQPWRVFLWTSETQSGFSEEVRRMQCDHTSTMRSRRLDSTQGTPPARVLNLNCLIT
jgi:hypothetical protein